MLSLRDELRQAKPKLLGGATVEDTVAAPLRKREEELGRKVASGIGHSDSNVAPSK